MSILDRGDQGRPIYVSADKTPDYILISVSFFVIIAFCIFMLYLVLTSKPRTLPSTLINCAPGQCATSLYNGEKRCGGPGEVITINPSMETCNSPYTCESNLTPFAVLPDGSTSRDGVCPPNVQCRCVPKARCPEYVTALFVTASGSPYTDVNGTNTSFVQKSGESISTDGVISYSDPQLSFCAVPLAWMNRTQPGCTGSTNLDINSISVCMSSSYPCQQGTLAFIPTDPIAFDTNPVPLINTTPLSCVRGERCPEGQIAYWNKYLGGVDCAFIPQPDIIVP